MKKRIFFNVLLLGAVFYTPWWIVAILAFIGAFLWSPFYEIIAFGAIVDLLYGSHTLPLSGILGLVTAVVLFYVGSYARKAVR